MHNSTKPVLHLQSASGWLRLPSARPLFFSFLPTKGWIINGLLLVCLLSLAMVNGTLAQQYTADFATSPTIDKEGFENYPGGWPWNSTAHVTLGGVEYLITNGGNDSWHWNGSALTYAPYGGNFTIKRKDGAAFKFYGVKLNYTSASTSNDTKPLTVNYSASSGTIPSDEYTAANANITIAKSGGVDVTLVSTYFYHLATLVFDDLVVGPASGSPTTPAPSFTRNPTATAVCIGTNATFIATASNATSFQWQQDDNISFSSPSAINTGSAYSILTTGTTSTLTLVTNASINGQYFRARATNSTGSTNSTGAQLTVNALPTPSITGLNAAYCKNASAVTLSGSPSGGSFTIDGNPATSLNPATLSASTHSVVYTYTNGNGCTNTASQQVTINALPTPSITGLNNAYCKDASAVTLSGSPSGGSFTIDGNPATSLNPATLSASTHSVVYTYTNGNGCTNTASQQVTINALPTPSITGLNNAYCKDASAVTLSGSPSGGSFTIDGNSATSFNPASLSVGQHTVIYTYTNGNGCTNTATQMVSVNALPTPAITGLNGAYCKDAAPVTLMGNPSGGGFTIDGTGATSFNPASLSVGQHTVIYTYTNGNGCTNTTSQPVTINALPTPSITGLSGAYCKDATPVTLSGSPSGGSFTIDGNSATSLNPAALSAGAHSVVYTYTNGNGCTNTSTQSVIINALPDPPSITTQAGHSYPAGQSNLAISQNTGDVILMTSGCAGGTISWNGGNNATLAVSTTNTGVFSFTANCTNSATGCTSPLATATVTVVAPTLKVFSRDPDNGQLNSNTIKPYLLLQNVGPYAINYSTITVRYWLTTENNIPLVFQKNYVQIGQSNVQIQYVPLATPRQGATGYIEYSFSGGAGDLAPGSDSGPIETQIFKGDYSPFNQLDDYSYINNSAYTLNPKITVYQNGVIFYGTEPSGTGSMRLAAEEVGRVLSVRVLGNPVVGQTAQVEISGAEGQAVNLSLTDLQGRPMHQQRINQAGASERVSIPVGGGSGIFLLQVATPTQRQQVKLLKP